MIVLAGDIGGTHARLALFGIAAEGALSLLRERTVSSAGYTGPAAIVKEFLEEDEAPPPGDLSGVCVAVAGPIRDGVCTVPNLGWTVELARFGTDVGVVGATLINDFEAIGHGVSQLEAGDYAELQRGEARARAPIAILGPGTGLGHAFLVWKDEGYEVLASEAGHADFAPRTAVEWDLAEHLRRRFGHASWERVLSGPGLVEAYRFMAACEPEKESASVRDELASGGDAAQAIARRAMAGSDALCLSALDLFTSALGAQAGNLALTLESYGGVYIAGGIAPQMLAKLQEGGFLEAFRAKGRLSSLVERIPVRVVLDPRIGLKGAARVAVRGP